MTLDQLRSNVSAYIAGLSMGGDNETVTNAIMQDVAALTAALSDQVVEGIRLAEREACAKIASDYANWAESKIDSDTSIFGTVSNTADDIAEMIRTQTAAPASTAGEVK